MVSSKIGRSLQTLTVMLPHPLSDLSTSVVNTMRAVLIKLKIKKMETGCKILDDYFMFVQMFRDLIGAIQKESEIIELLKAASKNGLRFACEIGTGSGGSFYLLCKVAQPDATVVTIDYEVPLWRRMLLKSLAKPKQTIKIIEGDSRSRRTVERVATILSQNGLDFLFIDGGHSYGTVMSDFINYSRFVGKGGLIAFHDIIPDFRMRFGAVSEAGSGDVPEFWNRVKNIYKTFEIVENPNQDGYGIGVVVWE